MAAAIFPTGAVIRKLWPQKDMYRAWMEEKPVLGLIPKDETFTEKSRYIAAGLAAGQGLGETYSRAKKNATANVNVEFEVFARYTAGRTGVDGRLLRRANLAGDKAMVVNAIKDQSKGLIQTFRNDWARYIYGDGSGRLATVDATVVLGSPSLKISQVEEIRTFDVNYPIDFVNPATGLARARTGDIKVVSVDDTASGRSLILNGNISTLCPTAAAGDWVIREGMVQNAPQGFAAWNPIYTTPSDLSTPFNGVTRSSNPSKLAGNILDAATAGLTNPRAIIARAQVMNRNNRGSGKQLFLNPRRWEDLANALEDKIVMTKTPAAPVGKMAIGIDYDGIQLTGANGTITVYADPDAPVNVGRLVDLSKWKYASVGKMMDWAIGEEDGWRVENDADEYELRLVSDGNMYCEEPWSSTTIVYPAYT